MQVVCKVACRRHLVYLSLHADTDACIIAPCISNTAGNVTCVDQPPPALGIASGRICTCDTGYVYLEGKGCAGETALQQLSLYVQWPCHQ
jgi:hypothetical protein